MSPIDRRLKARKEDGRGERGSASLTHLRFRPRFRARERRQHRRDRGPPSVGRPADAWAATDQAPAGGAARLHPGGLCRGCSLRTRHQRDDGATTPGLYRRTGCLNAAQAAYWLGSSDGVPTRTGADPRQTTSLRLTRRQTEIQEEPPDDRQTRSRFASWLRRQRWARPRMATGHRSWRTQTEDGYSLARLSGGMAPHGTATADGSTSGVGSDAHTAGWTSARSRDGCSSRSTTSSRSR